MAALSGIFLASFTTPMRIDTSPASLLWLIPLVAAIAVVYKATKVHRIKAYPFIKESAILFGSIMVFLGVAAVILFALAWVVTDKLPGLVNTSAF